MTGRRQKLTAICAALVATAALVAAGCSTSANDCQLGAHALAAAHAGKGGGKTDVKKQPPAASRSAAPAAPGPGKHAPRSKTPKKHHDDADCDDW
ncbi:hypothetical protein H114_00677 [Streptomyces gancidicus BKS 13-15]|uniref:Lipoprotein n=1 Tax=Streptomyces gancidicus BKS 13-15 TaxID=1284664 RepID=M3D3Y5_STREZ|nr:hypothetical protein [Streptomyces gancidicus]EMF31098.1 hypothetical protein H114_00677 [Streptomyces gancidicus BKS 13-15]